MSYGEKYPHLPFSLVEGVVVNCSEELKGVENSWKQVPP